MKINTTKAIKDLYSRLQDDESKMIFRHRLHYFLDDDKQHLRNMIRDIHKIYAGCANDSMQKLVRQLEKEPRDVVLYGAGNDMEMALFIMGLYGIEPVCCCDSDRAKHAEVRHGLMIISPEELFSKYPDCYIVISSYTFIGVIHSYLKDNNIAGDRIHFPGFYIYPMYFEQGFQDSKKKGVYIDAGCYNGVNIKEYIAWRGECCDKIIGFEPQEEAYIRTTANLSGENRCEIKIQKAGAWSENTTLSFDSSRESASSVSDCGDNVIEAVSIDSILAENTVAFIKMDIEGAELEALKGAANSLKRDKPELAISIYHRPEDILEIPLYLSELVPEYKFYIRHHQLSYFETVLYAVC